MAIVQISAELTTDKILEAVKQFNPAELEELTLQLHTLRAKKTTPHLSRRETELLKKINEGVPPEISRPLQELRAKMEDETITETEHAELLRLVDEMERFGVERLTWLIELAQLRNQTVPQLIDTLGLQPKYAH
jgi:uncharacterized coiled-coil DUF342 family protein